MPSPLKELFLWQDAASVGTEYSFAKTLPSALVSCLTPSSPQGSQAGGDCKVWTKSLDDGIPVDLLCPEVWDSYVQHSASPCKD